MYRNEHPNPQFKRDYYTCLNGLWEFGKGKCTNAEKPDLKGKIEVPFCPESVLSGIGDTGYIIDCVYSKIIKLTKEDLSERLVLHFGAVDYIAEVYVNGKFALRHVGGYTAFEVDIAPFAAVGENRITVAVHDDIKENIPSGKQSKEPLSHGCFYTRTTGIWQTVWLEKTPKNYIKSVKFYPDPEKKTVKAEVFADGCAKTCIKVFFDGKPVGFAEGDTEYRRVFEIPLAEAHLWEAGKGNLYDVEITFGEDKVYSYFGLRTVSYDGRKFKINGKSVFQRLVLDQGYYEDGIYTAKEAEQFKKDIGLSMSLGFNGARLHQKVFEQRFLYESDKAGYLVWGEFPSWGIKYDNITSLGTFVSQWSEVIEQYFNHPSIIIWCPLNEVWEDLENDKLIRDIRFVEAVYSATKTLDPTRPCVDTSGGYHGRRTDIFDFHNYHLSEKTFRFVEDIKNSDSLTMDKTFAPAAAQESVPYDGKLPIIASEYGGMTYASKGNDWGYHSFDSEEDFLAEYLGMTKSYLSCEKISGFCYTQLYDVEQEQNGLFFYDRKRKFSDKVLKEITACNKLAAAIEK
ncbi:MAG: beta-galactosidase [Clostridia bacterium]|nr:beta-galactosidase [Clostridia bacterium]